MRTLQALARALIVVHDPELTDLLQRFLQRDRIHIEHAADADTAVALARRTDPDVVIVDAGLPGRDGLDVLRRVRSVSDVPVVVLSGMSDDIDEIVALALGADDVVAKPLHPRVLVQRVKALVRRSRTNVERRIIRWGPLEVDTDRVSASLDGRTLQLTPWEYRMLEALVRSRGRTLSRSELLDATDPDGEALERTVDAHVARVRQKLADHAAAHLIETVRGIGYRLAE